MNTWINNLTVKTCYVCYSAHLCISFFFLKALGKNSTKYHEVSPMKLLQMKQASSKPLQTSLNLHFLLLAAYFASLVTSCLASCPHKQLDTQEKSFVFSIVCANISPRIHFLGKSKISIHTYCQRLIVSTVFLQQINYVTSH